jgi:hypothetical protein
LGEACREQQHRGGKDAAAQMPRFPFNRNYHCSRHMPPEFYRFVR